MLESGHQTDVMRPANKWAWLHQLQADPNKPFLGVEQHGLETSKYTQREFGEQFLGELTNNGPNDPRNAHLKNVLMKIKLEQTRFSSRPVSAAAAQSEPTHLRSRPIGRSASYTAEAQARARIVRRRKSRPTPEEGQVVVWRT